MKVILYPRVSSISQAKSGDSISAQIRRLIEFCEQKGFKIVDTYTDAGKSASISSDKLDIKISNNKFVVGIDLNKRPAFKRILDEVDSGKFEGVVFFMWDRFSRDNVFSKIAKEYFLRNNIKLIPSDDTDDPLFAEIKGSFNEAEITKMKEKVRLTRLNQFERGIPVGRCPVGYLPIFKNNLSKKLKGRHINPQTEFKKGMKAWNFEGRGRLKRKMKKWNGKLVLNSHYVFCKFNNINKIPKGFCIHHIDGNSLNDDIKNLILMSDKGHKSMHNFVSKMKKAGEKLI